MAIDNRFDEVAVRAVGAALLFRESRNGGSFGAGIDEARAARVADDRLDGLELYALLLDVANRAVERSESEARFFKADVVREVKKLAERTDSLTLHRFIEAQGQD